MRRVESKILTINKYRQIILAMIIVAFTVMFVLLQDSINGYRPPKPAVTKSFHQWSTKASYHFQNKVKDQERTKVKIQTIEEERNPVLSPRNTMETVYGTASNAREAAYSDTKDAKKATVGNTRDAPKAAVVNTGDAQKAAIVNTGEAQKAAVGNTGDAQEAAVGNTGDAKKAIDGTITRLNPQKTNGSALVHFVKLIKDAVDAYKTSKDRTVSKSSVEMTQDLQDGEIQGTDYDPDYNPEDKYALHDADMITGQEYDDNLEDLYNGNDDGGYDDNMDENEIVEMDGLDNAFDDDVDNYGDETYINQENVDDTATAISDNNVVYDGDPIYHNNLDDDLVYDVDNVNTEEVDDDFSQAVLL